MKCSSNCILWWLFSVALLGTVDPLHADSTAAEAVGVVAVQSEPLARPAAGTDGKMFEQLDARAIGIDFVYRWEPSRRHRGMISHSLVAAGVCAGDYDGDGLADVYLARPSGGGQLYRNLGDFRFEDVTDAAGLGDDVAWGTGASFADVTEQVQALQLVNSMQRAIAPSRVPLYNPLGHENQMMLVRSRPTRRPGSAIEAEWSRKASPG